MRLNMTFSGNNGEKTPATFSDYVGGTTPIDTTLTKAGFAADAYETGKRLDKKLDADKLDAAIETALTEAKESGDFKGDKGDSGDTPYIKDTYWWIGEKNTGIKAVGTDGVTPHIGANGNWWVGDTDTGTKAQGESGGEVVAQSTEEFANYNKLDKNRVTPNKYFSNGEETKNPSFFITDYIPCRTGKWVIVSRNAPTTLAVIRGVEYCDIKKQRIDLTEGKKPSENRFSSLNTQKHIDVFCMKNIVEECHYIRLVLPTVALNSVVVEVRDAGWLDIEYGVDEDGNETKKIIGDPMDVECVDGQKFDVPLEKEIPYWRGKTIVWNGDSIPAGYASLTGYPYLVGKNLSCNIINKSIGGSTLADNPNIKEKTDTGAQNDAYRNPLVLRYKEMPDEADLVCIAIGTNDWCYSYTPLGDMSSTGTGTFYGALKYLCEKLMDKYIRYYDATIEVGGKQWTERRYRYTPIVFFTPIKRVIYHYDRWDENNNNKPEPDSGSVKVTYNTKLPLDEEGLENENGKTLEDYANAIKEVCGYYGIPVLDLYNECLINPIIPNIKKSCFPLNTEVYVCVEDGVETELTEAQANAYQGSGEIVITTRRDGTHPNIEGHKILARRITGYIKQLADGVF